MKRNGQVVFAPREGMGAGKGDFPRPMDKRKFDAEWERIFKPEMEDK